MSIKHSNYIDITFLIIQFNWIELIKTKIKIQQIFICFAIEFISIDIPVNESLNLPFEQRFFWRLYFKQANVVGYSWIKWGKYGINSVRVYAGEIIVLTIISPPPFVYRLWGCNFFGKWKWKADRRITCDCVR